MKTLIRLFVLLGCLCLMGDTQAGERVTVLTLNVAGLPDYLTKQDNPEMRMIHMGRRAAIWDLVAYQEDFYYSHWLDATGGFEHRERGTKMHKFAYAWPWLRKSGLTISNNWGWNDPEFYKFSACHGHLNYASDCWVPKGVLCARSSTPGGLTIDFCNTHLDAGNDPGSTQARQDQIREYNERLPTPELDIPWIRIETGDYNLRTYQEDIVPLLEGREVIVYNTGEGNNVDYITVITNDLTNVRVEEHGVVPMFEGLSDHPAIGAILDVEY